MCTNKKIYQPLKRVADIRVGANPNHVAMNYAQVKLATDVLIMLSHRCDTSLGKTVERLKLSNKFPIFYTILADDTINYSKVRMVNRLKKELENG